MRLWLVAFAVRRVYCRVQTATVSMSNVNEREPEGHLIGNMSRRFSTDPTKNPNAWGVANKRKSAIMLHPNQPDAASDHAVDDHERVAGKATQRIVLPSPRARHADACGVEISGAYGPFSDIVNGVFEPTSQQCCGVGVYRKRDDGDKWLEYSSNALKWNVLDTAHRGQSWGWAALRPGGAALKNA